MPPGHSTGPAGRSGPDPPVGRSRPPLSCDGLDAAAPQGGEGLSTPPQGGLTLPPRRASQLARVGRFAAKTVRGEDHGQTSLPRPPVRSPPDSCPVVSVGVHAFAPAAGRRLRRVFIRVHPWQPLSPPSSPCPSCLRGSIPSAGRCQDSPPRLF